MKKLDKLILSSFIGPFILTFLVVVFILLTQHMLKYFDDIVGKDIGFAVLANLMFDFSIFMTPIAIPLAVLLSSLMTFGNLGEHFELTAVKSAGISLLRTLWPIFIFVIGLSILAFYSNNYFVPKAALNAYSLLYDIKQKKPALELKEGTFYNGIPDLSIKVNRKDPETGEIWDAIIYDHRDKNGNKKVTLADSGRMYTVLNDQYLILEMYSGHSYIEGQSNAKTVSSRNTRSRAESLSRVKFDKSKIVLDLSSFDMKRTKKELFSGNRIMRNLSQLTEDMDSLNQDILEFRLAAFTNTKVSMKYLSDSILPLPSKLENLKILKDSLALVKQEKSRAMELAKEDSIAQAKKLSESDAGEKKIDEPVEILKPISTSKLNTARSTGIKKTTVTPQVKKNGTNLNKRRNQPKTVNKKKAKSQSTKKVNKGGLSEEERIEKLQTFIGKTAGDKKSLKSTINRVRQMKSKIQNSAGRMEKTRLDSFVFEVQWHKIISNSFACLVMFLIGAPLGAIIKKGGLGIPVLISIFFFIIFYVLGMVGEKQAKAGLIDPILGVWSANIVLFPIGLFFLRQARNDVKLFDADFYNVALDKFKTRFLKKA
jgi:lipopolysaccharide export system permease protein